MCARSSSSLKKHEEERKELERELEKYQSLIKGLIKSDESRLLKTKKQKLYHSKVVELKRKIEHLGI